MWQPASNLSICLVDWRDRDSDCGVKNQLLVDGLGLAVRIGQWRARGTHRTGEESTFDSSVAQRSPVANTPVGVQLSDPTVIDVLLVLLAVPTEKGNSQVATVGTVASATCIDSEIHTANHAHSSIPSAASVAETTRNLWFAAAGAAAATATATAAATGAAPFLHVSIRNPSP